MQKFWDWLSGLVTNNPTGLVEFVRQFALALVLFGAIHATDAQLAGGMMALSAFLAMFNKGAVTPNNRVVTRVDADTGEHVKGPASMPTPPDTK